MLALGLFIRMEKAIGGIAEVFLFSQLGEP
jgi:hypothetical protein